MTVGFDLDDVILDFHGVLNLYHNERFGTSFSKEHFTSWHVHDLWGCSKEEAANRILDFYESPEHWKAIPMVGAVEAVKNLKHFHELHIITAKPEDLRERTLKWLDKYFLDMFSGVHFANHLGGGPRRSKGEVAKEFGIEIFVEDALKNAEDVASYDIPVLLFDSPWNQGEVKAPITRVHSWDEIIKVLSERAS